MPKASRKLEAGEPLFAGSPRPASISGKSTVDWTGFREALGGVETLTDPSRVKKRSRDFFWYSPILNRELAGCFGDLVVLPKSEDELARCLALAADWRVPVTIRGGGTGNYGQAVPVDGGLIVDMTRMNAILEVGPDFIRVQAGARIATVNRVLSEHGRELPIYPSTEEIATIGGFIAGGSGGIGSIREGMLRDQGNILALSVYSVEKAPRRLIFVGEEANAIHHAWGINGVIADLTLRTVPKRDWVDVLANFPDYPQAFFTAAALGALPRFDLKLLTTIDSRIVAMIRHLEGHVPAGRDLLSAMVAREQLADFEVFIMARGGKLNSARDGRTDGSLPPVSEFSFNHTTLQVLKADRSVTYLQITLSDLESAALIADLRVTFGDEVLMHHEFALLEGRLVAFDLPVVRFTSEARLYEIMDIYRAHGCLISDPHRWTIESGGIKPDYRHLAWKKRLDPHDLLNSAKSRSWQEVKHLSPEDIGQL
ncbi:FAD-binding oxidoreductase [Mesorhizobium sp. BAC0120]|uniref:FAD-binding oxidoreductase n=1 Tax=Mesorhizobium sp. BAC0120 TaxID=3090670 RepID=UPI00298BEBDF|nr:FAD-binding oxidoreductase [Mesorhizobium sp. BAC0120]MDW6020389.1 FAD-binding oxidoreductase [Mesorhizobium sp. BAC0120]